MAQFASQHPAQLRTTPNLETFFVFLDTTSRPFDKALARRAVALALDRGPLVAAAGGAEGAQATCQVLPPNLPGYRPYCPFSSLGYRTSVRYFADANAYVHALARRRGPHPQAGENAWTSGYPAPSSSFATVSCAMSRNAAVNPVGNYQHHPLWGVLLDQLWVR